MTTKIQSSQALKIGIQGIQASFHDAAARAYFEAREIQLVECASFRRLAEALDRGETDVNVMAIENSVAGSILPNYQLLEKFRARVAGEVYLRIELNLMALPGETLAGLQFVQSHPMALLQSEDFLARHSHLKVLEVSDTAEAARRIGENQTRGYGAIASRLAAETYGLEILEAGIESNKQNYTRFLIVERGDSDGWGKQGEPNKASLKFETPHSPGALVAVLQVIQDAGLNMTKLQSVPILGRPYEYAFHVDLEWSDLSAYRRGLEALRLKTIRLVEFGVYTRAARPWL